MTERTTSAPVETGWIRPKPARTGPLRSVGGYWRSADREISGKLFRGVPLNQSVDFAESVIRTAYRIADDIVDRGLNVARDLRNAGERRGTQPRDVVDGAERMLSKTLLAGLQLIEDAAAGDENPLRRLASAEYRMLGALFGLKKDPPPQQPAPAPAPGGFTGSSPMGAAPSTTPSAVQILNRAPATERRPVLAVRLELPPERRQASYGGLSFHPADATVADENDIRDATLTWNAAAGTSRLEIDVRVMHRRGTWAAGLYDPDGLQVGVVAIDL